MSIDLPLAAPSHPAADQPAAAPPTVQEQPALAIEEEELLESEGWWSDESYAFGASVLSHMAIVLLLALIPWMREPDRAAIVLVSPPPDYERELLEQIDEVTYSEMPQEAIGASSVADTQMAQASAETFAEVVEIPNPVEMEPQPLATVNMSELFTRAVAPLESLQVQKGRIGHSTDGIAGAVDRLTFEILQSMEERPTLVVWLMDQSGSLTVQRQEIRDRMDQVYEELGIIQSSGSAAFANRDGEERLLTSVIAYGESVNLLTPEPLADLDEIRRVVDGIEVDESGIERVFSAVYMAADKYKGLRRSVGPRGPKRNVLLVVVTDERGDDPEGLEPSIKLCRRWGMPVYVLGHPAPFGREHIYVKYVDPDPKYDQTPQWVPVDAGPETLMPERVQIGFSGNSQDDPIIDSGFGPYGLTRLCYETGGIYFAIHPNRAVNRRVTRRELDQFASTMEYFFDPAVMARYRPDYLAPEDYLKRVRSSPLRQALVNAAAMSRVGTLETPQLRFVRRDEARLAADLSRAQQAAARIEPRLNQLYEALLPGEEGRAAEESPRWQAGYDLAVGRVLAQKVRAETYNAMLAKAKRGMAFEDAKNNTWVLKPDAEISVGSKWQREADQARELLTAVVERHPGTPWALLAETELKTPIGWKWEETFTDLAPQNRGAGNNNNNPRPPQDDEARMLSKPPTRPAPKL